MQAIETIELTVNGMDVEVPINGETKLLEVLRDQLGLISPKDGCMPQGQCGCCTVLVDGKPKVSCAIPASYADGKKILTLEGVTSEERQILTRAFVNSGGLQCGFCIPGIVMRTKAILDKNDNPDREEICRNLDIHLCRCTGYVKIVDAIEDAARGWRGEPQCEPCGEVGVGAALPRYKGAAYAFGEAPYVADMKIDGLLEGAVVMSEHPRARVLSIDVRPARQLAGVVAVATAEDVPGERYQGLISKDWPVLTAQGEHVRCTGDVLCAIAATSRAVARKAAELVEVEYEVEEPVTSPHDALDPDAPQLHPDVPGNLLSKSYSRVGEDVEGALEESAHVVHRSFGTQFIEHAFLEPESAIVCPEEDGTYQVYSPGQGVFDDRRQLASLLGVAEADLTVELVQNGGAFGGKEDLGMAGPAAILAHKTGKPVRVTLSRDESIRFHPKRHPIEMEYWVGCDEEGHLTAVKARMIGDKGAYASVGAKVLERAAGHATGAYRVPTVDVEALAVYTNNPPCGAMRGFGANQANFAMESCLDELAEKAGVDPWDIRYRNALEVGDTFGTGQVFKHSVGLKKTLEAVKPFYEAEDYVGLACGIKNVGIGNGMNDEGQAVLKVEGETVRIFTGFTEMGQGLFTVLIQVAVEETGLSPDRFEVEASTRRDTPCGMTTASRATVLGGNSTRKAARKLKAALDEAGGNLSALDGQEFRGDYCYDKTTKLGTPGVEDPITHLSFGFATQAVALNEDGSLKKVVAAHDVGKVMNPLLLEGQIEGSVHMGLGFALTEELVVEDGRIPSTKLRDLGIIRARHMPEVECIFIEEEEPEGPYGAKGVGEIGLVPTAPAVANALFQYDGKRRIDLPMIDSPAGRAIRKRKRR